MANLDVGIPPIYFQNTTVGGKDLSGKYSMNY